MKVSYRKSTAVEVDDRLPKKWCSKKIVYTPDKVAIKTAIQNGKKITGATGLNLTLVIRNDVKQKCQNRCIFHTLWKRREPTQADMQVGGYGFGQVMALAKAVSLPDGKEYPDVYALCWDISGKTMRVKIGHREYNGKTFEDVKSMMMTDFPDCKHKFKENSAVTADTVAPKKADNFANFGTYGNINDYEEILSDGDVPF